MAFRRTFEPAIANSSNVKDLRNFPKLELCTQKPVIHKRKAQTNLPDLRATTIPKQKKRFRSASELGLFLN